MKYRELENLKRKKFFKVEDVAETLGIKRTSAQVLCSRYVKKGYFLRLKNNFYLLANNWDNFNFDDFLGIANFLQVPSYISFMSALSIYEITTQLQRDFFESASLKRTARFNTKGVEFNFYKLKKEFYFGYSKSKNIFIASKEKAFVDAIYLYSFGKYSIDFDSLSLGKLNREKLLKIIKIYPDKTKNIIIKLCKI